MAVGVECSSGRAYVHMKASLKNKETKVQVSSVLKFLNQLSKNLVNNLARKYLFLKKKKSNGALRTLNGCSYWKMKCVHPCQGVCQSPEQTVAA